MSGKMGSPTGRYKIVLAGHYRVGKTAIFRKLQSGEADGDSWPGSYGGEHQRSPQGVNLATGERSSMSSYASGREKWRSTIRVEQQHVNVSSLVCCMLTSAQQAVYISMISPSVYAQL